MHVASSQIILMSFRSLRLKQLANSLFLMI